ncbi:hypothetical protein C8R45DRAFT_1098442 [Mycena sanguinolenta]|nr:hypothetical protein C8R45DRAFT_1098442 [Mycena sanguinolenta]
MPAANKSPIYPVHPVQVHLPLTSPPRRRSNSAIISWAAKVQPGSPPPRSPRRRPSTSSSRRPSVCSRRPSVSRTPPATGKEASFDLTDLGYSSVFVHFPITPSTPSPFKALAVVPVPPVPASPKRKGLKHFRSLSALTRGRAKSVSAPAAMPVPAPPVPALPKSASTSKFPIPLAKPAKSTKHAKLPKRVPPPLATELALMQFTDGGSLEKHAQRVMASQAKAAGPGVGVGAVWRDGDGGMWWDEEERWEYARLLAAPGPGPANEWVQFDGPEKENADDLERRGSVSTQDSDLDARYLVQPASHEEIMVDFVPLPSLPRPHAHAMSRKVLLALPARPRRAAKHLNKPELVGDLAAFGAAPAVAVAVAAPSGKQSRGDRRRPAPLKLARPHHGTASAPSTGDVRRDFLAASFAPPLPVSASAFPTFAPPPVPQIPMSPLASARPRRLSVTSTATAGAGKAKGLRGLFRRRD